MRANDGEAGFYQTFWLAEESIGKAVEAAYALLHAEGFSDTTIVDYDWALPADEAIEIIPGKRYETARYKWHQEPFEPYFMMPNGIVPARSGHSYDIDDIRDALAWTKDEDNYFVLEACIGRAQLWRRFNDAADCFPPSARLEIVAHGHWSDDSRTLFMSCPKAWDGKDMRAFLDSELEHIVFNGHVEIAFVGDSDRSVLRLTDHKTLLCTSYDKAVVNAVGDTLMDLPIVAWQDFRNLGGGFTHVHYAWPGTPDRDGFIRRLENSGFSLRHVREENYLDASPE